MRALVFKGPWEMVVEDRPEPELDAGDCLIEIIATGICGSDLHGYRGHNTRRQPGQVMGHETVGRVLEDRTGAHPTGTIVTVNPVLGCGRCPACADGTPQRCPGRRIIGVQSDISSAFAERMRVPARNLVELPASMPADIGALVEPLAVGYHAAQRAGITENDSVYVVGGGPIGQAAALAARRLGSHRVVVAELDAGKRDLVALLGFIPINPTSESKADVVTVLGGPATVVVDAVGTSLTLQSALDISAVGARIVLVGMGASRVEIAAYAVSTAERTIFGTFAYDNAAFRETAIWAGEHAAWLEPLIEARVSLEEAPEAFRSLAVGELKASKVLVRP